MSSLNLDLLEISDEQVVTALESVANQAGKMFGIQSLSFRAAVFDDENATSWPLEDFREKLASILAEHSFMCRSIRADFQAAQNAGGGAVVVTRQPGGASTATISLTGAPDQDATIRVGLSIAFNKAFEPFHRRKIFAQMPPEVSEFYTRRESTLLRLEEIATRAAENTEAHRRKLDSLFEERRQRLEVDYVARIEVLQAEAEKRTRALNEKEKALTQREGELEKADNTHARRKLRQDLKTTLKERHLKFTLTTETENKRRPIIWSFLALMAVTLSAAIYFGWLAAQPAAQGVLPWLPSLRPALSLAGFAGAAIYFIRWQDRWSQIHADEEFRLKRLDLAGCGKSKLTR
jgi:hypothetical protein